MLAAMPHVSVTMYPGCTESEKRELTNRIVSSVVEITGAEERVVSVTVEEVSPERWPEAVYRPDILEKEEFLTKRPRYDPFA